MYYFPASEALQCRLGAVRARPHAATESRSRGRVEHGYETSCNPGFEAVQGSTASTARFACNTSRLQRVPISKALVTGGKALE